MTGTTSLFNPFPEPKKLELTHEEAQVLYDLFKHQYIDYENTRGHEVIDKVARFVHSGKVNVIRR